MNTSLYMVDPAEDLDPWPEYEFSESTYEANSFPRIDSQALRRDLDDLPPGPSLAWTLSGIDIGGLSGYDRVVVLRAHQRMAAHRQAMS